MDSSTSQITTSSTVFISVHMHALSDHVQRVLRENFAGRPLLLEFPLRGLWKAGIRKVKRVCRRAPAPALEPVTRPEVASRTDRDVREQEAAYSEPESREPIEDESEQCSPWLRVAQEYEVGDDVIGRVSRVDAKYILVELLPGAKGKVPLGQISREWVTDPSAHASCGDIVVVRVRSITADDGKAELSLREGEGHFPRKPISLAPGEPLFLGDEWEEELYMKDASQQGTSIDHRCKEHRSKRRRRNRGRKALQRASLKNYDRPRSNGQRRVDWLCTETGFLEALRERWDQVARDYPLRAVVVGPAFLAGAKRLSSKDVDRLLSVCVDIATGQVMTIHGRSAHHLRTSRGGGASQIVRANDRGKAWRCQLSNSEKCMRVHWWQIPSHPDGSVNLASVNAHDDFSIPQ